ncbi:MAG: hypothetical protein SGJ00_08680 [bacterium]|nr:hypothetical protein [bacterium]
MTQTDYNESAVASSLYALLANHNPKGNFDGLNQELSAIMFNDQTGFLDRSKQIDEWVAAHPQQEELGDMLFDLLMVQFLAIETHEPDYFDSQEWNDIENKTLDKGSEMLNLFLYLSEAKETEVEISLEDFLNEFLLVGEDEFQDEYRIYESLIVNDDLLDADIESIRLVQADIKPETGLADYFVPLVCFFQYAEGTAEQEQLETELIPFEKAVLQSMIAFLEN